MGHIHLVSETQSGALPAGEDLDGFHAALMRRYTEFCECLNLMPATAERNVACVDYALRQLGLRYIWEITAAEVGRFNSILVVRGVSPRTRGGYCSALRTVSAFLLEEQLHDITRRTGIVIQQPVTKRNAPRSIYCASYALKAPPTKQVIRKISRNLRELLPRSAVFAGAARDLVLFEALYLTACRSNELIMFDVSDVHERKGRCGEIHVRFGKGANGSGHRARWVPMLDGLDELLRWYVRDVRPGLEPSRTEHALFLGRAGKRLSYRELSTILVRCLKVARVREKSQFTAHRLRHARASHLFADGMNLVAVQKLLGHEFLATTQRYVHVDPAFVAKAHREMVGRTLALAEG